MTNGQRTREGIVNEMEKGIEEERTMLIAENNPNDKDRMAYFGYFNHFPSKLPGTNGRTQQSPTNLEKIAEQCGKSLNEFQNDISIAISKSGVDADSLRRYADRVINEGLWEPATAEIYKKLVVPVYIELRMIGYSHHRLRW